VLFFAKVKFSNMNMFIYGVFYKRNAGCMHAVYDFVYDFVYDKACIQPTCIPSGASV